jgi:hypothetical protein
MIIIQTKKRYEKVVKYIIYKYGYLQIIYFEGNSNGKGRRKEINKEIMEEMFIMISKNPQLNEKIKNSIGRINTLIRDKSINTFPDKKIKNINEYSINLFLQKEMIDPLKDMFIICGQKQESYRK